MVSKVCSPTKDLFEAFGLLQTLLVLFYTAMLILWPALLLLDVYGSTLSVLPTIGMIGPWSTLLGSILKHVTKIIK